MNRFPTFRRIPLTLLLVLLLVTVHETAWLIGGDEAVSTLVRACSTGHGGRGAWWKLITSSFVHSDWDHLGRNVIWLLAFGVWVELRLGTKRMAGLVLTAAIASHAAARLLEPIGGCGASGIVFALGAALVSRPIWVGADGLRRYSGVWLLVVYFVVICYMGGIDSPETSHAGHLGGLFAGLWFGALRWREDPPSVPGLTRLRHAGVLALVAIVLVASEAAGPRWTILQHYKTARRAEQSGDLALAERRWWALICVADPANEFDAEFIDKAARYRLRRHQEREALGLLVTVARHADTPEIHRDIGFLRANLDPPDMSGAIEAWRESNLTAPGQPDVLDALAQAGLFTDDTLLFRPDRSVDLARRAVYADEMRNARYIRTLAKALFEIDRYDEAFGWMKRALARADSAERVHFEADLAWMHEWLRENSPDSSSAALLATAVEASAPPPSR